MNFHVGVRFGITASHPASDLAGYTSLPELCYFGLGTLKSEVGDFIPVCFSVPDNVRNGMPKRVVQLDTRFVNVFT
ncbi:MAG: hypothetical protein ACJ8NS_05270 [Chthoniobacterales bacterium]